MRLLALLFVAPLAAHAAAQPAAATPALPQACAPQQLGAARFSAGEALNFKLDALGADVGTFDVTSEAPQPADRPRVSLVLKSRAKTSAFISTNVGRYEAFATSQLGPDLSAIKYREEVDEGATHKSQEIDFPPRDGRLSVRATKNGNQEPAEVAAGPGVRDVLSTLYILRAQALKPGQPICVEVLAAKKIWRLEGQVAARETIDTPLGKFATLRIDATATRTDDAATQRHAHIWVTEDARRLPLVAVAELKGRTIRAQLVSASGPGSKQEETEAKPDHKRVGAAIGR
jgi:hypothetical protein